MYFELQLSEEIGRKVFACEQRRFLIHVSKIGFSFPIITCRWNYSPLKPEHVVLTGCCSGFTCLWIRFQASLEGIKAVQKSLRRTDRVEVLLAFESSYNQLFDNFSLPSIDSTWSSHGNRDMTCTGVLSLKRTFYWACLCLIGLPMAWCQSGMWPIEYSKNYLKNYVLTTKVFSCFFFFFSFFWLNCGSMGGAVTRFHRQ